MGLMRFLDDRLEMMGNMLDVTGADLSRLPNSSFERQFRSAAYRCLGCDSTGECARWLSERRQCQSAPSFCPNAELMNSLRD